MGKLKVILSILTLICVALSFSACFGGEESALTFQLLSDGTYALTDCVIEESGEVIIPETYKGKKVTKIGDEAFKHCFLIEGITIPKSIKSIGADAIFGTERLTKINYLGSWDDWLNIEFSDAWSNERGDFAEFYLNGEKVSDINFTTEKQLKSVMFDFYQFFYSAKIPASAINYIPKNKLNKIEIVSGDTIPSGAFSEFSTLHEVTLSSGLKTVGEDAFKGNEYIEKVNFNGSVLEWATIDFKNAFANPLYYGNMLYVNGELIANINLTGIDKVANFAFINCENLTAVTIGEGVTDVGERAFHNCENLETIELGEGLKNLGVYSFSNCGVKNLVIPNSVVSIDSSAFSDCLKLTDLTVGNSVKNVYSQAFDGCVNVEKVNYLGTIDGWVSIDFEGDASNGSNPVFFSNNLYINDVLLTDAVINANTIKANSLSWCYSLKNIVIGENVKRIDKGVFVFLQPTSVSFTVYEGWSACDERNSTSTPISSSDLQNDATANEYLKSTYCYYTWIRN